MEKTIGYRLGFYIAQGFHYLFSRKPSWLYEITDKYNVSQPVMIIAKSCALILIFFFITDVHRYGAWYFGNASYVKPYWQFVYIGLWIPIVAIGIKIFFKLALSSDSPLVWIPLCSILFGLTVFVFFSIAKILEDDFRLNHGYLFLTDVQLNEIVTVALIMGAIPLVIITIKYILHIGVED